MSTRVSPSVKRLLAGGLLLLAALVVLVLGTGASGEDGGYRVRAIFDTASFVVPGEDVKVAGVKVGTIEELDVTRDNKAAIVLRIDDPAFQNFKQDASCTIRLQSLIGEKFVACEPTQPKSANAPVPPSLHKITRGDGEGEYLLPVENTSSPVDVDLLNDIMRLPERQRFAIIINELGVGLTGNGEELRAVVKRANPALQRVDQLLAILAGQVDTLAALARESDAALAPVARENRAISNFIDKAGQTAVATAARGDALEQNFEKLPVFLQELSPTMRRLGALADAGTPVFRDLRIAAPSVNTLFKQLGPFSQAALPTFRTLGDLADEGSQALPASRPLFRDVAQFSRVAKPLARTLARGLRSLRGQYGIERLLDVIFYTTGTVNGFDDVSHYVRSFLLAPATCVQYTTRQSDNTCAATFNQMGFGREATGRAFAGTGSASALSTTPPATTASEPAGGASLVDAPAGDAGAQTSSSGAPAGSGLLGYLLGNDER